ncbi:UDP-glucuronosyl UDP-glucosyltransferase domain containing protein [Aphelenchoides bicaudatus]|nr:UDP-glucuronosyl UDP-glucosyltransferase domain containing protein [Aphelenchoides bicaudatus]
MVIYTGRMADVLVRAGHNVTFFIPEIRANDKINGTKLARVVRMKNLGNYFEEHMLETAGDLFDPRPTIFSRRAEFTVLRKICEQILIRRRELNWMRNEKFDLAIVSNLDFCDLGLVRMLNIPIHIWTTTGPIHDIQAQTIGIPVETSYVPTIWDNFAGPVMTLRERLTNYVRIYTDRLLTYENNVAMTRLFRTHVRADFPEMNKIASDSALLFVNGNEFVDPVRPLPSKAINIGGVGLQTPTPLRGKFAEMAQKGGKGFVIFALGTAVPTTFAIPEEKKRQLLEAFSYFPDYHFIIKADREDIVFQNLSLRSSNVDIVPWLPQTSLLAHPNCKLFISHAGYNSILESALRGVPLLTMPLFFDQHHNAKSVEYRGIGRVLLPQEFGLDALRREIRAVLADPSFELNAKRIAKIARDKPNQPDETLVNWVNFVLANGALPELKPELANQSFIVYNHLDILGVVIFVLFVLVQLSKLAIRLSVSALHTQINLPKEKAC